MKFQRRVHAWVHHCFGWASAGDNNERNRRFLEESLELVQACGCTKQEALRLVDYVFGRPKGEVDQEVGGVMISLAALCNAHEIDFELEGEKELIRCFTCVDLIRSKQAAKPR